MAIIIGLVFLALSVWAVLPLDFPLGLNWGHDVVQFLKGGLPVLGVLVGLVAIFIGIADIKDRAAAKKEEAEEKAKSEASNQK